MTAPQWYATWFDSPYYQLLYDYRNDEEASNFIKRLINYLKIPNESRILDLACGNGRHSRFLASLGMQVTGIDLSPASIEIAKRHSCGKDHYYIHDMRAPYPLPRYDYIFNLFTSFGYFKKDEDHRQVLKNIKEALAPDGTFVMDFLNISYVQKQLIPEEFIHKGGVRFHIKRTIAEGYILKEIHFEDKGKKHFYIERVRAFTLANLRDMLQSLGFNIIDIFGSYELESFDEKSKRLIIIANH